MNDVSPQERALLDLVEGERERQCAALVGEAQARADAQRERSQAEARARIRAAFGEQRQRRLARLAAAHSHAATQRRLHDQRRATALLASAARLLNDELSRLWQDTAARRAWVARVAEATRRHVGGGAGWTVQHPPGWPAEERQALAAALADAGGGEPRFVADPGIDAGLRLSADGKVIDGTPAGLLADRAEIESRLLRRLEIAAEAR